MFTGLNQLINLDFTLPKPSPATGDIWYAAAPIALLMFASLVYSISSNNRKGLNIGSYHHVSTDIADTANASFQRSDDDISWKSATDVIFHEDNGDIVLEDDAKYAKELQIQESLLASMLASQTTNNASSSTHIARKSLSSWLKKKERSRRSTPLLSVKSAWRTRNLGKCSETHPVLIPSVMKNAPANTQQQRYKKNNNTITCPGLNCKSILDFKALRLIIPKDILIKWDELLCESTILESHKLYCPFADCSVLLVNDGSCITKIDCQVWHSEFSCKEFGKLNAKKKGKKGDDMAVALAKKKKWKKYPSCKFFVEKSEGCVHITCRCKYEFCYNSGAKWTFTHGGCRPRS